MSNFHSYVSEETRALAKFDDPISVSIPPYGSSPVYIGAPRPGVNIVVVEGRERTGTTWYLDTVVAPPLRECNERQLAQLFDEVRMVVPLNRKVAPASLDSAIRELAVKAQTHLL